MLTDLIVILIILTIGFLAGRFYQMYLVQKQKDQEQYLQ